MNSLSKKIIASLVALSLSVPAMAATQPAQPKKPATTQTAKKAPVKKAETKKVTKKATTKKSLKKQPPKKPLLKKRPKSNLTRFHKYISPSYLGLILFIFCL